MEVLIRKLLDKAGELIEIGDCGRNGKDRRSEWSGWHNGARDGNANGNVAIRPSGVGRTSKKRRRKEQGRLPEVAYFVQLVVGVSLSSLWVAGLVVS
jgi:hypothetical protein